ncbi:MAG TPA: energy transducer TonB [Pyrinomonadaceae bacterium]|nr:energy transducer TonB [Pyrinomonadaceae bacterium]
MLLSRLAGELEFFKTELNRAWIDCRNNPKDFATRTMRELMKRARAMAHAIPATSIALVIVAIAVCVALLFDRRKAQSAASFEDEAKAEVEILHLVNQTDTASDSGIGIGGNGRVGISSGRGEGSGATPKLAHGGGGGGDDEPMPPQVGKLPPPSPVLAAIPKAPPVHAPSLPVAGMDIDPALWSDLKAPVYGDPRSNSNVSSKGPGEGGGIGTNQGTGIGEGKGPGFGPGEKGNMGGGSKEIGCCGSSGGEGNGIGDPSPRTYGGSEVEQRARLLSKPEPQYTEEARRNQISGTVALRVVFSSAGEVVQIRALRTLPFGLTERAIAAARQIRFIPAVKGGHPVSVHMQLEYNFNLY